MSKSIHGTVPPPGRGDPVQEKVHGAPDRAPPPKGPPPLVGRGGSRVQPIDAFVWLRQKEDTYHAFKKAGKQDPLFLMCLPYIKSLLLIQIGPFMISDLLKWVLVSIVQFVICKQFYLAAYRALRNRSTNMDVFALGTSASYFYSVCSILYGAIAGFSSPTYFETSAMLITFVLFG